MSAKRFQDAARDDLLILYKRHRSWEGVSRHIFEKRGVWFSAAYVCAVGSGKKLASVRLRQTLGLIERRAGIYQRMSKQDCEMILSVLPECALRGRIVRAVDKINEQRAKYPTRLVKHDAR